VSMTQLSRGMALGPGSEGGGGGFHEGAPSYADGSRLWTCKDPGIAGGRTEA
jgi:hypothetical protein